MSLGVGSRVLLLSLPPRPRQYRESFEAYTEMGFAYLVTQNSSLAITFLEYALTSMSAKSRVFACGEDQKCCLDTVSSVKGLRALKSGLNLVCMFALYPCSS